MKPQGGFVSGSVDVLRSHTCREEVSIRFEKILTMPLEAVEVEPSKPVRDLYTSKRCGMLSDRRARSIG